MTTATPPLDRSRPLGSSPSPGPARSDSPASRGAPVPRAASRGGLEEARRQLRYELISGLSDVALAFFMWGHMFLVGSILTGGVLEGLDALYRASRESVRIPPRWKDGPTRSSTRGRSPGSGAAATRPKLRGRAGRLRASAPCRLCGTRVERLELAGRRIYVCRVCQPAPPRHRDG